MDYVLFGMGYGATLMLLGWALRTFGPERKYRELESADSDRIVEQRSWVRFIQGLGGVIAIAGSAMVLLTFVVMLINPEDSTGSVTALVIWGVLVVALLVWCWFYVGRYGLTGIWSRDGGYGFRASNNQSRAKKTSLSSSSTTTRVQPKPRIIGPDPVPTAMTSTPTADAENVIGPQKVDDVFVAESDAHLDEVSPERGDASVSSQSQTSDAESDPEYDFGDGADVTVPSELGSRAEAIRRLRERQARSGQSSN